jgi:hypothetical protein
MKKTMKFFSIAALALVGAVITSCSSSDDLTENAQQPQPASEIHNYETLTTTVGLDGGAGTTRALTSTGVKTFAEGETMALIYKNTSGNAVKAVSEELTEEDIAEGNKSATFTFTLDNPDKTQGVTYIYPAAMATETDPFINYNALYTEQDGTLTKLASNFDFGWKVGDWSDGNLPSVTLENQLAILALTLKNDADGSNITNSITGLTLSDGSNTYNVTRAAGEGPIYVAVREMVSKTIEVTATDGTKTYAKALTKSYAHNNGYNVSWKMAEVIKGKFSVSSTKQVYFSKGNLQATTTDLGANWTWAFAEHQWDKIGGRSGGSETQTGNNYVTGTGAQPTMSANGTVDLFGWSTSATYLGISNNNSNDNYSGAFVDWGSHADVIAGIGTGWRTMSNTKTGGATGEWEYLLTKRSTASGMRFYKAQVNGVNGLILFPDDWNDSYHPLTAGNVNNNAISFESTKLTASDWNNDFESHGAVFLPVAGQRRTDNHYVDYPNGRGFYWSSTPNDAGTAYRFYFSGSSSEWSYSVGSSRRFGYSVRLVRDVK